VEQYPEGWIYRHYPSSAA